MSVYNGPANDTDIVTSMIADNMGNVYVTGYSIGNSTGKDFVTVKYNSDGSQQWAERYNNDIDNGDDIAKAIAVDASGNVYVTGYSFSSKSLDDYITIKYSQFGKVLWKSKYIG
ncbi:MAG: SBBP repeat-containing protein, partial [bacterium]